jgi:hypothetical protein
LAEQTDLGLSAVVAEVCWFFASPTSPSDRYRLVALALSWVLFISAKDLLIEAMAARKASVN